MYCRTCGNIVPNKSALCTKCGRHPLAGNQFCYNCKFQTYPNAVLCVKCGISFNDDTASIRTGSVYISKTRKDWLTTLLLAYFLGVVGAHRFYTGHKGIGILQLMTFGGCGLWTLIDIIQIVLGNYKDANGNTLVK